MTTPGCKDMLCPFEICPNGRGVCPDETTIADIGASVLRHTAGRIDALLLKIPSLIWVGLLQSTKIAIKFVACVITLNQSKHISQDWSFSGLERDTAMLMLFAKKTYLAAKDVIFAPKHNYKPSGLELFEGLGHVFGGDYHNSIRNEESLTGKRGIAQLLSAADSYSGNRPF